MFIAGRWFTLPNLYYFLPVPVCWCWLLASWLWRSVKNQNPHARPFVFTLGLIFLGVQRVGASVFGRILFPPDISLYAAAAPP
ncbi:hypothetical protein KCP74_24845 [Salmonella enterica subsp. enterica]|nr:hypothetical protein KCP74_24845 [Salmonella enterica subsp. enterica]